MKYYTRLFFILFLVIQYLPSLFGNCKIHEITGFGRLLATDARIGQTFISCMNGKISSIDVYLTTLGEHTLWIGRPNGGLLPDTIQTFNVDSIGIQTVFLNKDYLVEEGQEYEFQVQTSPNLTGYLENNLGPDYEYGESTWNGWSIAVQISFSINIENFQTTSLDNLNSENTFIIYPTVSQGRFNYEWNRPNSKFDGVEIIISNVSGHQIYKQKIKTGTNQINLNKIHQRGVLNYLLRSNGEIIKLGRIILL